ncbi:hypothetical protein AV530_014930 [Patagioenas fasciata monilis]|uniref:Uncharacterized protein n=1 Tax=Patagioenas fasciata monilis TaxID=372326 RepID=A0A1V4K0E7_PATFA|nr:hypothetical protein AV530_014930 [Patagioenas fasciata monilis]
MIPVAAFYKNVQLLLRRTEILERTSIHLLLETAHLTAFCLIQALLFMHQVGIRKRFHSKAGTGEKLEGCWWKSCDWNYSLILFSESPRNEQQKNNFSKE